MTTPDPDPDRGPDPCLRLARPGADAGAVRSIYAPVVRSTAVSFEEEPPDETAVRDRIERTLERYPWLVAEADGRILSYAHASARSDRPAYRWSVDVSVYVREGHREAGLGGRLLDALLDVLRLQGYYTAYAVIALPNPASVGLFEAAGFERVGRYDGVGHKLGAWHDVGHWGLRLAPLPDAPAEPDPPAAVRGTEAFERALA